VKPGGAETDFRSPISGLYICNTSQIYPEDRGTNYNVRIARQAVELLCEEAVLTLPPNYPHS
jgi:hypothetical protein